MIRDANKTDLLCLAEALVRLQEAHVDAFPDLYRRFDQSEALPHVSNLLARPDAMVRVAINEQTVVGHAVCVVETRPASMFQHAQRFGHIIQIEVHPDFRLRGIGRSLLADCEELAASHGLRRIVLDVWAFNDSAKSFFRTIGYEDFGSKLMRTLDRPIISDD